MRRRGADATRGPAALLIIPAMGWNGTAPFAALAESGARLPGCSQPELPGRAWGNRALALRLPKFDVLGPS